MDLDKIAAIGADIYNRAIYLDPNSPEEVNRLKELATALFAELDNYND